MKYLLEMILVAVLIVVLYQTPSFLHMHLNTILGKLLLVSAVAYLAMNHGLNTGLLGSFIVIVLLNSSVEGFKEGMDNECEDDSLDDSDWNDDSSDDSSDDTSGNASGSSGQYQTENFSNINRPMMASAINLVDQDRMFKVNALKNNQKSRGLTNGVVNDVKGLLNRVSRLELLQEHLEDEMMHPDNLESY